MKRQKRKATIIIVLDIKGWVGLGFSGAKSKNRKTSLELFFSTNVWSLQFGGIQVSTAAQNDDAVCPYNANWLPGIPPTCGE
jgi:hypothetical protein